MKKLIPFIILSLLLMNCSDINDELDKALLENDRKELALKVDSYSVLTYKFIKVCVRASAEKDNTSPEFLKFQTNFIRVSKIIHSLEGDVNDLTVADYLAIYSDFVKMTDYINNTNEDEFPTLTDAANAMSGDVLRTDIPYLEGEEKIIRQNYEHAFLSAAMMASSSLGKDILLYECMQTKPELLADSESKSIFLFIRGFLFFEAELYYLSENEISQNINWLDNNRDVELPILEYVFDWGHLDQTETHLAYHSLNHLFRGFNRIMMKRDIDEQRALEDFQKFVDDSKELGLDNELIWSIEAFLFIKAEDSENAIISLKKLKQSTILSEDDKEIIEEAIEYLKDRESDKALNGIYDKFFLGKIAVKYMYNVISKTDWENLLKENDIPYTDEIFNNINSFTEFTSNLNQYTSGEAIEEIKDELLEEGDKLLEEGKELLDGTSEELEDKAGDLWDDAKGLF